MEEETRFGIPLWLVEEVLEGCPGKPFGRPEGEDWSPKCSDK